MLTRCVSASILVTLHRWHHSHLTSVHRSLLAPSSQSGIARQEARSRMMELTVRAGSCGPVHCPLSLQLHEWRALLTAPPCLISVKGRTPLWTTTTKSVVQEVVNKLQPLFCLNLRSWNLSAKRGKVCGPQSLQLVRGWALLFDLSFWWADELRLSFSCRLWKRSSSDS